MASEQMDYPCILADLEAKRAALEQTIVSLRAAMALGALGQAAIELSANGSVGPIPTTFSPLMASGGEVPAGAFHGKSIPDAAKLYLEIVKKKQTSKEIAEALVKGGMESTSKNFPSIVHSILDRARRRPNPAFVKLGTQWGLASWYPNFVPGAVSLKAGKKKAAKKKASTKPAEIKAELPSTASQAGPVEQKRSSGERIIDVMKTGTEYTRQEIAKETGIGLPQVSLAMANLVRAHKAEITSNGKYRIPTKATEVYAIA